MATSARRNSESASSPCCGATAMPMLASIATGGVDQAFKSFIQEHPVGQAGQPVMQGLVPQVRCCTCPVYLHAQGSDFALGSIPFGYVACVDHQAEHTRCAQEIRRGRLK